MKLKLSKEEYDFLRKLDKLFIDSFQLEYIYNHYFLQIRSDENYLQLDEWLKDSLMKIGFDEEHEINKYGLILEDLIDRIYKIGEA